MTIRAPRAVLAAACLAAAPPDADEARFEDASSLRFPLRPALLETGAGNYRRTVDYALEARLLPEERAVEGRGRIVWRNHGSVPIRDLWWHLYLNAFKNARSTFIRESGGQLRGDEMTPGAWGWIEVTRLAARPAGDPAVEYEDVLAGRTFEHPDDDNADDRTVMRTPLPFEVAPGAAVELEVAFTSKLPRVFARSGYAGDFFMVAQWFPKLGVLQETLRPGAPEARDVYGEPAWRCHQYHAKSEFFADYGHYRVAITVPEGYVVGATGRLDAEGPGPPGTMTYEYEQERVHDFAWAADPRFLRRVRTFRGADVSDAARADAADLLGVDPEDLALTDVEVTLLLQPEHAEYEGRYFGAVFAALERFGLWYAAYPYRTLTLVDGPRGSGGAMGMEYPTLVAGGVTWPAPEGGVRPELVTIHEVGHQWWYGLVGTDEYAEPWLDEGLTTYSTGKVLDAVYGPLSRSPRVLGVPLDPFLPGLALSQTTSFRMGAMFAPDRDRVARAADAFRDARSYGVNAYPRAALVLRQLEEHLTPAVVTRGLRLYQVRNRYRHPSAADLVAAMEDASGRDLDDFFARTLWSAGAVDYAIAEVRSKKRPVAGGVFTVDGAEPGQIAHRQVGADEARLATEASDGPFDTEVLVVRKGEVPFAHSVEVAFADGSTRAAVWDGRYRWRRFSFTTEAPATSARLYADRPMLLDVTPTDDTWAKDADDAGRTWGAHVTYGVQVLLDLLGGLL